VNHPASSHLPWCDRLHTQLGVPTCSCEIGRIVIDTRTFVVMIHESIGVTFGIAAEEVPMVMTAEQARQLGWSLIEAARDYSRTWPATEGETL
jgi:hypothetical protein